MQNNATTNMGWWKQLRHFLKSNASLTVIITAAILLQALSAVQYYYTRSLLADELEKRAESEITTKAIIVKNTLNMAENSLMGHVWNLKQNILHPDSSYKVMEWVLKSHPHLTGCWVAYVPNFFPEKGRLFEPFAWWDHGEIKNAEIASDEGRDYTQNRYYKAVYASNTPMWTDLYRDAVSGLNLVTYVRPIHDNKGDIVAMFGLDMSTEQLGDTLNYRHIYPSSYNFLLTETGQLIAGPKHKTDKKKKEMEHIIKMMNDSTVEKSLSNSGRTTFFPIKDEDGDEGVVFYVNLKGIPKWKIAVVCYDKEVYAKLIKFRSTMGFIMLLALLILGLIITRFAKNGRKLYKMNMEQERIGSELRIATNIQKEMLPKTFPPYPDRNDIDIYGVQIPAREVGGDLFDFFLRDEKLFFCIGDVSGKGVPSAMVMAVIHSLFRMASAHESNPARIMQTINETSCEGNKSNMFVTLFIGVLDLPTGHLRYCDAGHDAPIVLSEKGEVNSDKFATAIPVLPHLPIGVFDDITYNTQETMLAPDSTIFLYTDGLTEAKKGPKQFFGLQRTEEVLNKCARQQLMPQQILETVSEEVHRFVGDAEQSDDLTMLAIRYTPKQFESTLTETLTIKNDIHEVKRLSSFMKSATEKLGIEMSLARQLRLAVEEAVVNVIDYAYPVDTGGDITINMMSDGHTLRFQIIDAGVAFDPTMKEKTDTTLSAEDRQIGGLGILLMRELMDSINYERTDGKNILTLIKNIK
jgi:sigma-B regulation protein RsbU (phosphoserine phosphatase)